MFNLLNYIIQNETPTDGGLEALLFIIKFYKGSILSFDLDNMIQQNYPITSTTKLINTASKCDLVAVEYDEVNISKIVDFKKPIIIRIIDKNRIHHAVCIAFNKEKGFLLWKSKNNENYVSIEELKSLRVDNKCIAFSNN